MWTISPIMWVIIKCAWNHILRVAYCRGKQFFTLLTNSFKYEDVSEYISTNIWSMYNSLRDKSDISCYYTFNSRFNGLLKPLPKKKIIFFQKKRKCVCALKKCIINLKIAVVPNLSFSQSISVLSKRFSESNHKIMKESKSREGIWDVVVSEILIC